MRTLSGVHLLHSKERHEKTMARLETLRAQWVRGGALHIGDIRETHFRNLSRMEKYRAGAGDAGESAPWWNAGAGETLLRDAAWQTDARQKESVEGQRDDAQPAAKIQMPDQSATASAAKDELKKKSSSLPAIKYPLKFKLIASVTMLLVAALGAITVLVSVLVSKDVQLTAEVNNFSINRRSAESINNELKNIRSSAASFLNDAAFVDTRGEGYSDSLAAVFFMQQPQVSGIALCEAEGGVRYLLPTPPSIPQEALANWIDSSRETIEHVYAGETLLRNVSPVFNQPQLVMLLPVSISQNSETSEYAAAVFFSQDKLTQILGTGANVSFVLNEDADVLVHPNESFVMGAANFSAIPFVGNALESAARGTQTIYTDENGIEHFGVYNRLVVGNTILITIIKRSDIFAGIAATTRRNVIIGIVVLLLSIGAISIFASSLSKPLRLLTKAARKIERGDYNLRLRPHSRDEIGVLTQSFIGMGNGLENFEKFTNKAIVKFARRGKLTRSGINKNITVAFIFIRDFNEFAKNMTAEQIVEFINEYLEQMVPCITKTGGIVDKFLTQGGVIIMAVWGSVDAKTTPQKNAMRCVKTMLAMRTKLVAFNNDITHRFWGYAPRIKIGCGINSGEVVAGQMGSEQRMEYTVIGDTVNLAARLEGANDVFDTDMLISENTWMLIRDAVSVKEMPNIEVKGKAKPLRVFTVIDLTAQNIAVEVEKI